MPAPPGQTKGRSASRNISQEGLRERSGLGGSLADSHRDPRENPHTVKTPSVLDQPPPGAVTDALKLFLTKQEAFWEEAECL